MDKPLSYKKDKITVTVYLDKSTHEKLVSSKNRSGRTKSKEIAVRLQDHLQKYPNYYMSTLSE